jgi:hypothetical protein
MVFPVSTHRRISAGSPVRLTAPRAGSMKLLLAFLLASAGGMLAPLLSAQFVDKAQTAGVDLNYPTDTTGHTLSSVDAYSMGSASCAVDLDGDGWTDLIVAQAGKPCLVFMNNRDGTFREEGHARGLDTASDIGGIAAGDLSNKGSPDVFMAPVAGSRYYLFVNDGTGHFTERAIERGADIPVTEQPHLSESVSLVDYDRDGYLDIYVCEWKVISGSQNAQHSVLLHNKGRSAPGFFENKTAAAGLTQPARSSIQAGYTAVWVDLDGDGYPDLFLAGDFGTTQLWWNNGDGTFTDGTDSSGIANGTDGMGATLLDYDGDGKVDIFMSAISLSNLGTSQSFISDNRLYRNLGNRRFAETSVAAGVKESGWGWGTGALDANNDGRPDLFITNGYIDPRTNFSSAATDPSRLYLNLGGTFADRSAAFGITDTGLGRSVCVLDYDNDGREDVFLTNTVGHRILYHNENSPANAHWLALKFTGTTSNRDGYGCLVSVSAGGKTQTAVYNPTNAYLGQREPRLHFGLGASTAASTVTITWPSGTVQTLSNVAADQLLGVTEPGAVAAAPTILTDLKDLIAFKDDKVTFTVTGTGTPDPVYTWYRNGVKIDGANGPSYTLSRVQPIDAGGYAVQLINPNGTVTSRTATLTVTTDLTLKSTAHWWDEALLEGIRKDTPNPPVHARNLYHLSATLWDAYWAYERNGWSGRQPVFTQENPALPADEPGRLAAQQQAMSYAAYTVIRQRFANSPGKVATLAGIRWLMQQYGFDPDYTDATGSSPASTGIRIGQAVLAATLGDGANEAGGYADATGFTARNPKLTVRTAGVGTGINPDFWQPLDLVNTITQNGIVLGAATQKFVGSNAINTRPWALQRQSNRYPVDDPGPPPFFSTAKADYVAQARQVIEYSSQLTTADSVTLDISPGKLLNNTLGTNDGTGHAVNPATGQPYAADVVARGDYARVLAEFWADGPNSETPPGHWNVLFNTVSDNPLCTHQLMGQGAALPRLQWDVAGYLALNGALHDAACVAWTLKWEYNSARPITMIRYLATQGQSTDPAQPSYSADGLPLVSGLIEVVTSATAAAGQRHAGLTVGKVAIKAWLGVPPSPTQVSGVGWIEADSWVPYQLNTFVTPAFPAYISGHSTFSRAGAEALARLTGNDYFPGGLASYSYAAGSLQFESGPSATTQLQWATYFDAADQAGLSRLFGGIHIAADDFTGRKLGAKIGDDAFNKFLTYFNTANGALPTITGHPAAQSVAAGSAAAFHATATYGGAITYQWQRMPTGTTAWANVTDSGGFSGSGTPDLSLSAATAAMSGDLFRAVLTTAGGTMTTHVASLSVTAATSGGGSTGGGTTGGGTTGGGSSGGGGGGGGAPSPLCLALLVALGAARTLARRTQP